MSELLPILRVTGTFLGAWCLVSVACTVPLIAWFRAQGMANALQARDGRRSAWLSEAQGISVR